MIECGILCNDFYKLNFNNLYVEILMKVHHNIKTKSTLVNESAS